MRWWNWRRGRRRIWSSSSLVGSRLRFVSLSPYNLLPLLHLRYRYFEAGTVSLSSLSSFARNHDQHDIRQRNGTKQHKAKTSKAAKQQTADSTTGWGGGGAKSKQDDREYKSDDGPEAKSKRHKPRHTLRLNDRHPDRSHTDTQRQAKSHHRPPRCRARRPAPCRRRGDEGRVPSPWQRELDGRERRASVGRAVLLDL